MNENIKWGAAAVAVVGLAIGAVVFRDKWWSDDVPPAEPVAAAPAPAVAPPEPEIKHPVPAADGNDALPALDDSSLPMKNALADLFGAESVERFVVSDDLIRHIVVSVDNLTEQKLAERLRPVRPAAGGLVVGGTADDPVLDPANYERYKPMVQLIRATDTQRLVATYVRYYPLFQESYENLGHPPRYFNDRVIQVIDLLLAAPDVSGPVALAQPGVQYEFADPRLEALPAGQKILIRMGDDNAKVVKEKLRELRSALVALPAQTGKPQSP
jgi:hypothetical protein